MTVLRHYTIYVRSDGTQCSPGDEDARQLGVVPEDCEWSEMVEYHQHRYRAS
jgi:ribosomal protein L24E